MGHRSSFVPALKVISGLPHTISLEFPLIYSLHCSSILVHLIPLPFCIYFSYFGEEPPPSSSFCGYRDDNIFRLCASDKVFLLSPHFINNFVEYRIGNAGYSCNLFSLWNLKVFSCFVLSLSFHFVIAKTRDILTFNYMCKTCLEIFRVNSI